MKRYILFLLFGLMVHLAVAQNYMLHSVYIYGFTRYVVWPEAYNKGDFEIVVLGDSPIMADLNKLAKDKKVGDRTIVVKKISAPSEIKKCNMLFIPASHSSELGEVMAKVGDGSVLIITEEPGLGAKGSHINFIMKDGKLAFELNQSAVSKHHLKVLNALTSMAILI